jgi:ABC-2 type transport system ATP-binding protein
MSAAIESTALSKNFGDIRANKDVDLEVLPGEIFGYLGPNGAGKTTTIRILLDFIRPTSGTVKVLGLDPAVASVEIRARTGYLPGELHLYDRMTGWEHVDYFASLRGGVERGYVVEVADRFDLDLSRPTGDLSKGNKQKVGIVLAFMHRPELFVLDEPTGGLDPLMQQAFHTLMRDVVSDGATVFLSSHMLSEVERVAHRVGIIRQGELIVVEQVKTLLDKAPRRFEVHFSHDVPDELGLVPAVRDLRVARNIASFIVEGSVDPVVKILARSEVVSLITHEADLEEIFLAYYSRADDEDGPG